MSGEFFVALKEFCMLRMRRGEESAVDVFLSDSEEELEVLRHNTWPGLSSSPPLSLNVRHA